MFHFDKNIKNIYFFSIVYLCIKENSQHLGLISNIIIALINEYYHYFNSVIPVRIKKGKLNKMIRKNVIRINPTAPKLGKINPAIFKYRSRV